MVLLLVAPEIDGAASPGSLLHPEEVAEERQAAVEVRRQQLYMREMRDVIDGFGHDRLHFSPPLWTEASVGLKNCLACNDLIL